MSFELKIFCHLNNGTFLKEMPNFINELQDRPIFMQTLIYTIFKKRTDNPVEMNAILKVLVDTEADLIQSTQKSFLFPVLYHPNALHMALLDNQSRDMIEELIMFGFASDQMVIPLNIYFNLPEKIDFFLKKLIKYSGSIDLLYSKTAISTAELAIILDRHDLLDSIFFKTEKLLPIFSKICKEKISDDVKKFIKLALLRVREDRDFASEPKNESLKILKVNLVMDTPGNNHSMRSEDIVSGPIEKPYIKKSMYYDAGSHTFSIYSFSVHTDKFSKKLDNLNSAENQHLHSLFELHRLGKKNNGQKVIFATDTLLKILKKAELDEIEIFELNNKSLRKQKKSLSFDWSSLFTENNTGFLALCFEQGLLTQNSRIFYDSQELSPLELALEIGHAEMIQLARSYTSYNTDQGFRIDDDQKKPDEESESFYVKMENRLMCYSYQLGDHPYGGSTSDEFLKKNQVEDQEIKLKLR